MLTVSEGRRYFLSKTPADMRKGFDGLCGVIRQESGCNPLSGDIFIFLNKRRNQIKLLLWEGDGFSLYHKRLERGTYELPVINLSDVSVEVKAQDLLLILQGISLQHIRKRPRYTHSI
jgi:transposase